MNEDEDKLLRHIENNVDLQAISKVLLACSPPELRTPANQAHKSLLDWLVCTYLDLSAAVGQSPTPDMLRQSGLSGAFVHVGTCRAPGTWVAFRRLIARRHAGMPYPTLPIDGTLRLEAQQKGMVYRALRKLPSVEVEAHLPLQRGSTMRANFRVTSGCRTQFVELAMVVSDPDTDDRVRRRYREQLWCKLGRYSALGLSPVVIWADDLVRPRRLLRRVNEVAARLHVAPLPLPPSFEAFDLVGEAA